MLKRSEFVDPRMKYTPEEIAEYNREAYYRMPAMLVIRDRDKWVPPRIGSVAQW